MGLCSLELTGLVDDGIYTSIGYHLLQTRETMDIPNLSEDDSGDDGAYAGNSGQVLLGLSEQFVESCIYLFDLSLQELDLSQEAAHLQARCVGQESDADRMLSGGDDLPGFELPKSASTGGAEDVGHFSQVKGGEVLGGDCFLQQTARGGQEHIREEGFVFGEDSIQEADDPAFGITYLVDQGEAEAG
jgi:hypothetical protein